MYNKKFAEIYNKEWVHFSEILAYKVLNLTTNRGSVLDLGCGTGNFLQKLEPYFTKTVGIDISRNMIRIAKQNCCKSIFYIKDVTDFNLDEQFDLITCNFDMINHLQTIDDWSKMFNLVYKHLNKGGLFLFDINTIYKFNQLDFLEHISENEKYKIVAKDTKVDNNHIKMFMEIFDKQGKKLAFVNEVESFYDEKTIKTFLKNAGFKNIKFIDKNFNKVNNFKLNRLFILCTK